MFYNALRLPSTLQKRTVQEKRGVDRIEMVLRETKSVDVNWI
jgi:hypothetical protein